MLMKLTPGVNFTNILRLAIMCKDPHIETRKSSHKCLFELLGSAGIKAAQKHGGEIVLRTQFHQPIGAKLNLISFFSRRSRNFKKRH
jgi:hypothetical protein